MSRKVFLSFDLNIDNLEIISGMPNSHRTSILRPNIHTSSQGIDSDLPNQQVKNSKYRSAQDSFNYDNLNCLNSRGYAAHNENGSHFDARYGKNFGNQPIEMIQGSFGHPQGLNCDANTFIKKCNASKPSSTSRQIKDNIEDLGSHHKNRIREFIDSKYRSAQDSFNYDNLNCSISRGYAAHNENGSHFDARYAKNFGNQPIEMIQGSFGHPQGLNCDANAFIKKGNASKPPATSRQIKDNIEDLGSHHKTRTQTHTQKASSNNDCDANNGIKRNASMPGSSRQLSDNLNCHGSGYDHETDTKEQKISTDIMEQGEEQKTNWGVSGSDENEHQCRYSQYFLSLIGWK